MSKLAWFGAALYLTLCVIKAVLDILWPFILAGLIMWIIVFR